MSGWAGGEVAPQATTPPPTTATTTPAAPAAAPADVGGEPAVAEGQTTMHTGPAPGARVYVGNLSWETRWPALKDHMRQAGNVTFADVMLDADSRSKGCGIVEYETAEEGRNAIATLNDSMLDGRMIFVREDREAGKPRPFGQPYRGGMRGGRGGRRGGFGGAYGSRYDAGPDAANRKLFVRNLPFSMRWQDLKDAFSQVGTVERADVFMGADHRSKGVGVVVMASEEEAQTAITRLNGEEFEGRAIEVRLDKY